MRNIIKKLLRIYLLPITSFRVLYFYVLDIFFSPSSLHIARAGHFIKKNKPKGSGIIIDIGCHERGFIDVFLKIFENCTVIGYEPNVQKFDLAKEYFSGFEKVIIKNLALGDTESTMMLNITKHDYSSSLLEVNELKDDGKELFKVVSKQECKVVTLDSQTSDIDAIMLIKIDTQGFELKILQGALKTLEKTQFILIEMMNHNTYANSAQYYEIDRFLRNAGFSLVQLYSPLSDATEFDALYQNIKYGQQHQVI